MQACDTVIFLDYPLDICLNGVKERKGKARSDMPWTETEEDTELTAFINSYNNEERLRVLSLLEKCSNKSVTIFKSREEADAYLSRITEKEDR